MPGIAYWTKVARDILAGRKIVGVEYVEWEGLGELGLMLTLDDGTEVTVSKDDEGNGPGALHTTAEGGSILPVIWGDR